jgi:hypothetical protein
LAEELGISDEGGTMQIAQVVHVPSIFPHRFSAVNARRIDDLLLKQ